MSSAGDSPWPLFTFPFAPCCCCCCCCCCLPSPLLLPLAALCNMAATTLFTDCAKLTHTVAASAPSSVPMPTSPSPSLLPSPLPPPPFLPGTGASAQDTVRCKHSLSAASAAAKDSAAALYAIPTLRVFKRSLGRRTDGRKKERKKGRA